MKASVEIGEKWQRNMKYKVELAKRSQGKIWMVKELIGTTAGRFTARSER